MKYELKNFRVDAFLWLFVFVLALIFSLRDFESGQDTPVYLEYFYGVVNCNCILSSYEPGFELVTYLYSMVSSSARGYLFILAAILVFAFLGYIKMLNKYLEIANTPAYYLAFTLLAFTFLMSSNFFLTAGNNGIRQGLAAPFIFMGCLSLSRRKYSLTLFFYALALSFHFSSIMYIVFTPLVFVKRKLIILILALASVSYAIGFSEYFIKLMSSVFALPIYDFVIGYSDSGLYEGFNILFFLYSLAPLMHTVVNRVILNKYFYSDKHSYMFAAYTALILPYLILGFASFSNRYAFTAWLFMPIYFSVVSFEAIKKDNRSLSLIIIFCIGFLTLFITKMFVEIW